MTDPNIARGESSAAAAPSASTNPGTHPGVGEIAPPSILTGLAPSAPTPQPGTVAREGADDNRRRAGGESPHPGTSAPPYLTDPHYRLGALQGALGMLLRAVAEQPDPTPELLRMADFARRALKSTDQQGPT